MILVVVDVFIFILLAKTGRRNRNVLRREVELQLGFRSMLRLPRVLWVCVLIVALLSFSSLLLLVMARTGETVPILWDRISQLYIVAYFVLTFLVGLIVLSSFSKKYTRIVLLFVIVHSFILHSYMPIVYGTIYGGDQWWHMANEEQIIRTGVYGPVLFGDGSWKELNRSEVFQGIEAGKLYVKIGGFNVPYAFVSGKVSYTFLYSVSVSFSQLLNIDVFFNYWLLVPILWSLVVPAILFNVGRLFSWKESTSLLLSFLPSFFYFLNMYGSNTAPISLGIVLFFPSLLTWFNYLVKGDSKSLLLAVALTGVLYFNYSLVWVLLIMMGILSVAIRFFNDSRRKCYAILIVPLLFLLIMAIPFLDTFENRSSFIPELTNNFVQTLFFKFAGYLGDRLMLPTFSSRFDPFFGGVMYKSEVSSQFNLVSLLPMLILATTFLWIFVIAGIRKALKKRGSNRLPMLFLVVFFLVLEFSTFVVWYLLMAPHAMGLRLNSFRQIFMLLLAVLGLMYIYEFMKTKLRRVKTGVVFLALLIAFESATFYVLNPVSQNIASYEMDAIRYIYENNAQNNYVVITYELPEYYLRPEVPNFITLENFSIQISNLEREIMEYGVNN